MSTNPSGHPSTLPSVSPLSALSLQECFVDENGFYGKESGNPTEVNYFYQVRLVPNTTSSDLESDMLDSLEAAIAKKILPNLFQDTCGRFRRHRIRKRSLQQSGISGVSARPSDFVFDEVLCQGSESDCFVADGRMTVHGSGVNPTEVSILVKDEIRNLMQSGELIEGVDERITSVEYLDDINSLRNRNAIIGTGTIQGGSIDDLIPFPIWGITVIAAFGVLFLIGGLSLWRRRRNDEDDSDSDNDAVDFEVYLGEDSCKEEG